MSRRRLLLSAAVIVLLAGGVALAAVGAGDITNSLGDPSTVDIDEAEPLTVTASETATVTGSVDAAEGTDLTVRLQSADDERPFIVSATATVDESGQFEVTFDLSDLDPEREATLTVTLEDRTIERTLLIREN